MNSKNLSYQSKTSYRRLIKFIIVLLLLNIFAYIINGYTRTITIGMSYIREEALLSVAAANFIWIFIFIFANSYDNFYKTFSLNLSFSITRKDFFINLIKDNLIIIFILSIIQAILLKIDPYIVSKLKLIPLYNLGFLNTYEDNIIYMILIIFIISSFIMSLASLLAASNYKFGSKFWIVGLTSFLFLGFISGGQLYTVLKYLCLSIFKGMNINNSISSLGIIKYIFYTIIVYLLNYQVIRRSDIHTEIG